MVLFTNVCINQRVEVKWRGGIYEGVVRFKGSLSGIQGDWVGVALVEPVGEHSGLVSGRRYFQCLRNHGIFVPASHIRFIPSRRHLYDNYKAVTNEAQVDEHLFGWPVRPGSSCRDPSVIEESSVDWVTSPEYPEPTYEQVMQPAKFHLRHSVGHHLPAANSSLHHSVGHHLPAANSSLRHSVGHHLPAANSSLRHSVGHHLPAANSSLRHSVGHHLAAANSSLPETRLMHTVFGLRSVPYNSPYGIFFDDDEDNFISSPSIPMPHMPHAALKKQVKKGWDRVHYPRHMSVNTGRDSIKYSQWNDISA